MEVLLHKNLVRIMKKKKITFKELSLQTSIPVKTLYGWIDGPRVPRNIIKLKQVCSLLDVSLDEILFSETPHFGQQIYVKGSRIEIVFTS